MTAAPGQAAPSNWVAQPHGRFLLWAVQSSVNIGMILRVAEGFQIAVHIYDPHGIFDNPEKRCSISDFACGALQRMAPPIYVEAAEAQAALAGGRVLVTSIEPGAHDVARFRFRRSDWVLLGNEYDGLPREMAADAALHIAMPAGFTPKPLSHSPIDPLRAQGVRNDGKPNLNVAISAGILGHRMYHSLRGSAQRG